jgi:predicted nucleotidyltransferase
MNKIANEIKQKLKERLLSDIPDKILKIMIFDSYARGDETPDSDLGILVVVNEKTKELERQIFDIAYDIMWGYDFSPLISLEIMTEKHLQLLQNVGSSFYARIEKEMMISCNSLFSG